MGLLAMAPAWLRSGRSKQIRGDLRRMVRADAPRCEELADRVLSRARSDRHLLELVVREGRRREQWALAAEALSRLRVAPRAVQAIERLEAELQAKEDKVWGHPIEAAAIIERLLDARMWDGASEKLAEALVRFPGDADLAALTARLERASREEVS